MASRKHLKNFNITILLIAIIGLLSFIIISNSFSFGNKLFRGLYPKKTSLAQQSLNIPQVDLKVIYQNSYHDGVVNIFPGESVVLVWTTTNNPSSCEASSFGISDSDKSWKGKLDPGGGKLPSKKLPVNNPYVYSINCKNGAGDSTGDSVTVNVGAQKQPIAPYIIDFNLTDSDGEKYQSGETVPVSKGDKAQISWKSINTKTPYSLCVVNGSWPAGVKNLSDAEYKNTLSFNQSKIYTYSVYCSNENSFTQTSLAIVSN